MAQMQVWNKTIAFAYPSLASGLNGDVAMSLAYGGGGNHISHAVGSQGNSFAGAGYGTKVANKTNNCPSNGTLGAGSGSSQNFCFDPHFVTFHR